ncbi:methanethiol S-methyltransferase [Lysobacter sp. CA199]|uniref:methanethiol S-methyltransferase n=1 Tax=Lysobacter sp. CA199 TaxID=3455608 RepID=UPI003F8D06B9
MNTTNRTDDRTTASGFLRLLALLYGTLCYGLFLVVFLYAIGFVMGKFVPKNIDSGTTDDFVTALTIDLALLALFAVQHSGMARQGFKRWWTRIVPAPIERSTYVLLSSAVLALLFWQWRPLAPLLWDVQDYSARCVVDALAVLGWLLVLSSTFIISHFDLFGLRQVWLHARNRAYPDTPFVIRAFYRFVRHPLYLGFAIAFWAAPTMSLGHLLFAVGTTSYILIAIRLEERDLVAAYGDDYRDYQRRVPKLLPLLKRRA